MRWKNMSDKCQVLKWQRVTGHGVNSNGSTLWKLKCAAAEFTGHRSRECYKYKTGEETI